MPTPVALTINEAKTTPTEVKEANEEVEVTAEEATESTE